MEISEYLSTINDVFTVGRSRELMFQDADDQPVDGKHISIQGRQLLSFGSCSYLGLETDPRLREGVARAAERYGTQFSTSRGYVSVPIYRQVEEMFSEIFGAPTLVTPTTTLGHMGCIPVLVNEKDAIILDHQVHASVQLASTLARASGATVEVVRHGDLGRLEERVEVLCRTRRHVWHMIDGVFSMFGDLPNVEVLTRLLNRHEQFHVYVDDAHGMSVDGKHGRGVHLARMPHHPRMMVSTSFAKAFAAGGGCLIFPDDATRQKVRMCGAPLTFGGPMQPPMLGALLAGCRIHLSDEIETLKGELRGRINRLNDLMADRDLPLLARNHSPIFFLKTGPLRLAWNVADRMQRKYGLYVNVSAYPTVPLKRSGIRIAVTRHHSEEDLLHLVDALAEEWPRALADEGLSREEVDQNFWNEYDDGRNKFRKLFAVSDGDAIIAPPKPRGPLQVQEGLELQYTNSIRSIDAAEWNSLLGDRGSFDAKGLEMLEGAFKEGPERENQWKFHYFIVRLKGKPVLATFFTEALMKDDMLMRSEVSLAVEGKRKDDPYFLTSRALGMGSMLSEGNHLYLDREGPWRESLAWVLDEAGKIMTREQLSLLILRDLPSDDPELDEFVLDAGLVKAPMLTSYDLAVQEWKDDADFVAHLGKNTRKIFREEVIDPEGHWTFRITGDGKETPSPEELTHLHQLYRNVKGRKTRLNTFDLPEHILQDMCRTPGWELVLLHLSPEHGGPADGRPVGFVAGHHGPRNYTALMCGLDYAYQKKHTYRQILWQVIRRARFHGCVRLALGVDADFEKVRLRARPHGQCVYVQAADHFGGAVMRQIVEDAALGIVPEAQKQSANAGPR